MKTVILNTRWITSVILGLLLTHATLSALEPQAPLDSITSNHRRVAFIGDAKVKSVVGDAYALNPENKVWEKLQPGTELAPGRVIRTDAKAEVILLMQKSESFVRITPMTVVRLAAHEKGM